MDNPIMNAALEYASRGWSVIPVSRTKQPLVKWKTSTREELTNPDNIREWWTKYPTANVAIVTGKRSGGLVVIDLDIDDQKGIDGRDSLQKWCDQNDMFCLESCATVETGRGGKHLYFQSDNSYHNQVGCLDGVDIRGEGGIVVAPPSIHGTTKREYIWDIDEDEVTVPKADSDVVYFLASMEAKSSTPSGPAEKNDFTKVTKEGGRNNQLFKYISRLQGEGETDEAIRDYASIYNKTHLKPPLDDDEVERTVESVLSHTEWKGTPKVQEEQPKPVEKKKTFRKLKTAEDLMQKEIPDPIVFIGVDDELPLLVEGTCILSAKPKLGKSWFALSMCLAIASGETFLGYKTRQCSTLYLDLETSESIQKKRLGKVLKGKPVPKKFYLETATDSINNGFLDQLENYLEQDPDLGVIVVDVFTIIRSPAKSIKESEYDHAYRDLTPLNQFAQNHHISIILVCHDRKAVDENDPFANILGSTGLQGAATQMVVMFRKKKDDPIHISVKGKTIDGEPQLNVQLEDAEWKVVEAGSSASQEMAKMNAEYQQSDIREAVIKIAENNSLWTGRCTTLINDAVEYGVGIRETAKDVGYFLHRHLGRFLSDDGIQVTIIKNGGGGKMYKIQKFTVDTVDESNESPLTEWQNASEIKGFEDPFL